MHIIPRSILLPLVILCLSSPLLMGNTGCGSDGGGREANATLVRKAVDDVRSSLEKTLGHSVPSLNILLQTPDATYFVSSVGRGGQSITPDTYFHFASNTKSFTATAILKMQQDGWLNIDDRITNSIPGSSQPYVPATPAWNVPNKNTITIRELLQHSAGVYDVDNDPVPGCGGQSYVDWMESRSPDHQFTAGELVNQAASNNLSCFLPGAGHHYSNTGFTMLGEIVARVYSLHQGAPKTCSDYLHDHVVSGSAPVPLDVRFPWRWDDQTMPAPYVCGSIYDSGTTTLYCDRNYSAHVAEGNGIGTMAQLNRYIRTLMQGANVLSARSVSLMQTSASAANPSYGLGCIFMPNLGFGHNGAIHGNLSIMAYNPITRVSVVAYMPFWDDTEGETTSLKCFNALYDAAYAALAALGYPGKP